MSQAIQAKEAAPSVTTVKVKERTDKTLEFELPVPMLPPHRNRLFLIAGDNLDALVPEQRYPELNEVITYLMPGTHKIDNLRVVRGAKKTKFELTLHGETIPRELRDNIEKVFEIHSCKPQFMRV